MGSTVKQETPGQTVENQSQIEKVANPAVGQNTFEGDELFALLNSVGTRRLRCEFCSSEFSLARDLRCHICPRSGQVQSRLCLFCPFSCKFRDELLTHIRFHHEKLVKKPKPILNCPQCSEKFTTKTALNRHKVVEHPQAFTCRLCQMRLKSQKILDWHMEIHRSPEARRTKIFSCGRCLEIFSTKQSLIRHLQQRHDRPKDPEKMTICGGCGTRFFQSGMSRIVKFNRHLCGNCDCSSASVTQLMSKLPTVKMEVADDSDEAEIIRENLVEISVVKEVKVEPVEPAEEMPSEPQLTESPADLSIHVAADPMLSATCLPVMTSIAPSTLVWRPFHCGLCPGSEPFGDADDFRCHLKSHSTEETEWDEHSCGNCGMKFKSRRCLFRHIDRGCCGPFVCRPCRQLFTTRLELSDHQQLHGVNGSPLGFKCSGCQTIYMHKRNLERHMERGCARFRCRKCRIHLADLEDYNEHREKVHKILLRGHCVKCGQRFESGAELSSHFKACSQRG